MYELSGMLFNNFEFRISNFEFFFTLFHPICGTFNPRTLNLLTSPFNTPRPATPGASSLFSNNSCSPRHNPRKGLPAEMASFIGSTNRRRFNSFIASPNAPTPGKTSLSHRLRSAGLEVTLVLPPTNSSVFLPYHFTPTRNRYDFGWRKAYTFTRHLDACIAIE